MKSTFFNSIKRAYLLVIPHKQIYQFYVYYIIPNIGDDIVKIKTSAKRVVKTSAMKKKLNTQLKKQVRVKNTTSGTVRSTGVLKKNPSTTFAHTEVMNRRSSPITATVMVFNWDTNSPVRIGNNTVTIPANSLRFFNTNLAGVNDHYEVVIILSATSNVIVNHFGVAGDVPQDGNIVLDRDLISITL